MLLRHTRLDSTLFDLFNSASMFSDRWPQGVRVRIAGHAYFPDAVTRTFSWLTANIFAILCLNAICFPAPAVYCS